MQRVGLAAHSLRPPRLICRQLWVFAPRFLFVVVVVAVASGERQKALPVYVLQVGGGRKHVRFADDCSFCLHCFVFLRARARAALFTCDRCTIDHGAYSLNVNHCASRAGVCTSRILPDRRRRCSRTSALRSSQEPRWLL